MPERTPERRARPSRGLARWTIAGAVVGAAGLALVLWHLDLARTVEVVGRAEPRYLGLVLAAVVAEQLLRAWKWHLLLHDVRPVPTLRLFGAFMAGYLAGMLAPVSPLVRAWLVARREGLALSAVLASAAVDRLLDGIVFSGFVAAALALAAVPEAGSRVRDVLAAAGVGTFAAFAGVLAGLAHFKRAAARPRGWVDRALARLPERWRARADGIARAFASGIAWPRSAWRRAGVVGAAAVGKLVAATHLLWAGLAFGIVLEPAAYLFLLALLGFVVVVGHFARIPGSFLLGGVFALELFGVDAERAFAMVLVVQVASLASVAVVGAIALGRAGVTLDALARGSREARDDG